MIGSDSNTASTTPAADQGLALAFGLTLAAAFVLPLIPIWESLLRLLAFAVLVHCHGLSRIAAVPRRWLTLSLVALSYLTFVLWTSGNFLASPLNSYFEIIQFVHGVPEDWDWSMLRVIVDIYLFQGLMRSVWPRSHADGAPLVRAMLVCLAGFWVLPHIHLAWSGLSAVLGGDPALQEGTVARLEQDMAGLSGWTLWVLTALMGLRLLHNPGTRTTVLACVFFAGVIEAALVLAQHAAQDFSYVIEADNWQDYFRRARGSYYYHSASALFLTLAFFLGIGARTAIRSPTFHALGLSLMALAIYQNSTKAIALGVIAGGTTFAIMQIGKPPNWRGLILALGLAALFMPEAFVFKTPEATANPVQVSESQMVQANQPRLHLLIRGIESIWDAPVLGQGVGSARIKIVATSFSGITETYSSHALPVDVAVMAGIPAFLFLGALVALTAINEFRRRFVAGVQGPDGLFAAALMAFLAAFVVTSVFFPRERNLTIALVFMVFALSAATVQRLPEMNERRFGGKPKGLWFGLGTIGLAGFGWAIMTSSTAVFPVGEFIARHMREPLSPRVGTVHVNSSRLESLMRGALFLTGAEGWDIRRLADDPDSLPREDGWILWDPNQDQDYSQIRQGLGSGPSRGWGLAPSFRLPSEWQPVRSMQSAVSIIRVGARMYPPMPAEELGRVIMNTAASSLPGARDDAALPVRAESATAGGEACSAEWIFEPLANRQPAIDGYELEIEIDADQASLGFEFEDAAGSSHIFQRSVSTRGGLAKIREQIPQTKLQRLRLCILSPVDVRNLHVRFVQRFMPDMARTAEVWEQGHANPTALLATDNDNGSAWVSMGEDEAVLVFEPREHSGPLSVYRLSGVESRDERFVALQIWWLEGSKDGVAWQYMDQRSGVVLPWGRREFGTFYVERPGSYRYYRLRMRVDENNSIRKIGLTEVQLFAAPE